MTEVAISLSLAALLVGGLVLGYVQSIRRAEWSAYSLAAQSLAMQRIEQTRAAKWDPLDWPPVDQVVSENFPPMIEILDIPMATTNGVTATLFTTIATVTATPPLKLIRVDCVWPFMDGNVFTNTITTCRAPDQ